VGLTPLSTQLPVGTQQLSISRQGYTTEQAFLQLDPAPAGAKPVRTRVVLREEAAPAAQAEPVARARTAAPARPPARKAAPARRGEPAREETAAASAEAAPEPAPKAEPAPSAPLVEERSRVKLVDGQGRARLLE